MDLRTAKRLVGLVGVIMTFCMQTTPYAADVRHGQDLHDQNCLHCHDTSQYTRPNHRIKTLEGLRKQVERCELSLELQWFEEDIEDVVAYLNATYYQFNN
ncbi:MAG: cytochrome c [Gammaproteobacteria bacterium]|nr:cytochrome c [Gammaproteobacteria bacterium]